MATLAKEYLENINPADIGDELSMDEEYVEAEWGSPPPKSGGRRQARDPLTPTLSLPDSFDGEYGNAGSSSGPFNRDLESRKLRAEAARLRELLQDRSAMFRDLVSAAPPSPSLHLHLRLPQRLCILRILYFIDSIIICLLFTPPPPL